MKSFNNYLTEKDDAAQAVQSPSNKFFDEYFLDAFEYNGQSVKLKTIGSGLHAPIKVYINDAPWEMFKGENKARRAIAQYIDSGEYEKTLARMIQAQQAQQAQQKAEKKEKTNEGIRDWFQKSSADGKKGWVQVGGKYDGKPCARQPGQKTTPKCVSSSKRRSMSKKEKESAFRRKNQQDPNQPQKTGAAKPTMVKTDVKKESVMNEFAMFASLNTEILEAIREASTKNTTSLIKLENGDVVKVSPDEARVLMMVHDELNTRNRHTFEKLLQSRRTYNKLLYFVKNELGI